MTNNNLENMVNCGNNFAAIDNVQDKGLVLQCLQNDYLKDLKKYRKDQADARLQERVDRWNAKSTGEKILIITVGGMAALALGACVVVLVKKIMEANEASGCGCDENADASLLANV